MSRFEGRNIRWGIEERLALIEFRLLCEEFINCSDSTEQIGVSVTRISKGLRFYIKNVPRELEYETSTKRHLASINFQPILLVAHTDAHLTQLLNAMNSDSEEYECWLVTSPDFDLMPTHYWRVRVNVMRLILLAIHDERVIEVECQSVSAQYPVFEWRWNTPHALDRDVLRWHVRTYCPSIKSSRIPFSPVALMPTVRVNQPLRLRSIYFGKKLSKYHLCLIPC